MKRRRFLKATAAASALPLVGCLPGPGTSDGGATPRDWTLNPDDYDGGQRSAAFVDAVPEDLTTFALGVAAGGMLAESTMVWGHVEGREDVHLMVWRETETEEVVVVFANTVPVSADSSVRVDVAGLAPATEYRFAFMVPNDNGQLIGRSEVGSVTTAWPEDWRKPLTLGAVTCTSWENRPYRALEVMAEDDIDLFVHLGDMGYNDEAFTSEEYKALWRETLTDPGYRALLSRTGGYYAWDDHEFQNDLNPETVDPARFAAARDSFFTHVAAVPGDDGQLWRSYRWGETAEIFVLDCRTQRRPSQSGNGVTAYLGEEQTAWLKQALTDSPCHFKILLNSVPMTLMPELWALSGDRWQGYPLARSDLLRFLEDEGLERVWFLSGDFHMGFVGRVGTDGYSRGLWEVAVGPSGNLGNPLALLADDPENRPLVFPESQFLYGKGRIASTTLTFDPEADEVRVRFIQASNGEVLFDQTITPET